MKHRQHPLSHWWHHHHHHHDSDHTEIEDGFEDERHGRHHGMFGRGGFFGHHRRGRRRIIDSQELRLVVLQLISEGPRHGYDVIQAIGELTSNAYSPSPGMIYPALSLLEDTGFIEQVQTEGPRKAFAVTDAGRAEVEKNTNTIRGIIARLSALTPAEETAGAAPIQRAMLGLKTALRAALHRPDARPDLVHDIAAILDGAAQQIERLK